MATLRLEPGDTVARLVTQTRIGRGPENDLRLPGAWISSSHARLHWTVGGWELRDLGSTNGTYLDGHRLSVGQRRIVRKGARIVFADPRDTWILADDDAPCVSARNLSTQDVVWEGPGELLVLPDTEGAALHVYRAEKEHWVTEHQGRLRPVKDQDTVRCAGNSWLLSIPETCQPTEASPALALQTTRAPELVWHFSVSSDQDYSRLALCRGETELWHTDRTYTYTLLVLARARLDEMARGGIERRECGWMHVDALCKALGFFDAVRLNVEICRARADLVQSGVVPAGQVVERRRGTGQLRIGTDRIVIRT